MSVEIKLTKMERQLLLFSIISKCEVTERIVITSRLPIEPRMLQRDIKDLTEAGLLSVTFSKKENGYVHRGTPAFDETATGERKEYLVRLNRLGTLMDELYDDGQRFWRDDTIPLYDYDEGGKAYIEDIPADYFTALDCYYELYPHVSEQTRRQDFETLRRIGYELYCTPTGDYYVENEYEYYDADFNYVPPDFGVRRREDGNLVRELEHGYGKNFI